MPRINTMKLYFNLCSEADAEYLRDQSRVSHFEYCNPPRNDYDSQMIVYCTPERGLTKFIMDLFDNTSIMDVLIEEDLKEVTEDGTS